LIKLQIHLEKSNFHTILKKSFPAKTNKFNLAVTDIFYTFTAKLKTSLSTFIN